MQVHIRILESTQENISNLLLGLEYLISISYVDDTEVFKVCAYCISVLPSLVPNTQIDTVFGLLKITGLFGLLEFLGVRAV
jgi:exportin-1